MKRLALAIFILGTAGISRAQLVMSAGVKGVFNGGTAGTPVYFVINNPTATPIVTVGANNGLMMEAEFNILKYNLGTATTAVTVPYMSYALESFPLTVNGITAGTGTGSIQFSTVKAPTRATGWDNATYLPTGVANMNGFGGGDVSASTIDRFWIINAVNYTTNPQANLNFTFIPAEAAANGGNTCTAATILAQEYDDVGNSWNVIPPSGTNNGTNMVSNVATFQFAANYFDRVWTLNSSTNPLPVTLTVFKADCKNGNAVLNWSTASETNSSYFSIEKSYDGRTFFRAGTVSAAGNSSSTLNYIFTEDSILNRAAYYRLREVDNNGESMLFKTEYISPCSVLSENTSVIPSPGSGVDIFFYSLSAQSIKIRAFDVSGRMVVSEQVQTSEGSNQYHLNTFLAEGIYLFVVETNEKIITKKLMIPR
ncbi:MAG TPA: T9SS type A sorting domain-containing protein [Bacteroidia bacterium]|nr:T9SS type A sorting domain-containing protein [Bacteroidia bacterium]